MHIIYLVLLGLGTLLMLVSLFTPGWRKYSVSYDSAATGAQEGDYSAGLLTATCGGNAFGDCKNAFDVSSCHFRMR